MLQPAGRWEQKSALTLAGSVAAQIAPGTFVGAEARYIRKYDGLGLDTLSRRFSPGRMPPFGCRSRWQYPVHGASS